MDIKDNTYTIKALLSNGKTLNLTDVVEDQFEWGAQKGDIAQRLNVQFAQADTPYGNLSALLSLCTQFYVFGNGVEVFRGTQWEYNYNASTENLIPIIAYDRFKYAMQSKEHFYYSAGMSTKAIISDMCSKWGIPLNYTWQSWTHPKTKYAGTYIGENIINAISEAQKHLSTKGVALFEKDTLIVRPMGSNKTVWVFEESRNAERINYRATLDDVVTRVRIYGKEDNDGRSTVQATVNGNLKYGTLQDVIYLDDNTSLATAKQNAAAILKEKGNPIITVECEFADVPEITKGDKIKIIGGCVNGYYYVDGISHNAIARKMSLEVEHE
jgi:hypothetical protein